MRGYSFGNILNTIHRMSLSVEHYVILLGRPISLPRLFDRSNLRGTYTASTHHQIQIKRDELFINYLLRKHAKARGGGVEGDVTSP